MSHNPVSIVLLPVALAALTLVLLLLAMWVEPGALDVRPHYLPASERVVPMPFVLPSAAPGQIV
ncbi:MAG: hypothetical protein QNK05_02810 [Myxococcota bacterium]|nr:hypothetical protein [Myxococcota bacterium]